MKNVETNKKICILVVSHKTGPILFDDSYKIIAVGKNKKNVLNAFYFDDVGDNIANKNDTYNEFTAQYFAYKNIKNIDIVGLCHYRRYFFKNYYSKNRFNTILSTKDIQLALKKKKVILPRYIFIGKGLYNDEEKRKNYLYQVVSDLYPSYKENIDILNATRYRCSSSAFICSYDDFLEYSKWCFDILFEIEKRMLNEKGSVDPRSLGFIGESLPNVFFSSKYKQAEIKRYSFGRFGDDNFNILKFLLSKVGFFSLKSFFVSRRKENRYKKI